MSKPIQVGESFTLKTQFHERAFEFFRDGKIGRTEFEACLFFDTPALQSLLFSMIRTQNDYIIVNNLRNMTRKNLDVQQVQKIVEVICEHKGWESSTPDPIITH